MPEPVTVEQTGKRGRPRKHINLEFLEDAMDSKRNISISKLAKSVGVHRNTLRYYLKFHNVDTKFSSVSDKDLDLLVKTFRHTNPDSGIRYLVGFLRRHGLKIQKERVRASIKPSEWIDWARRSDVNGQSRHDVNTTMLPDQTLYGILMVTTK